MPYMYGGYGGNSALFFALLVVMLLGFIAQARVQGVFDKYDRKQASARMPAEAVARSLLRQNGSSATVTEVRGSLTDHFNPRTGVVGLSQSVYGSSSVAAIAVAAHEIGHVMQYEKGYGAIRLRNAILPVANIGSQAAPLLVILGLFLSSDSLMLFGVILFSAVFLFQLITLPVEFNASSRAMEMLESGGYVSYDDAIGAKRVLRAAAMTYVVSALASLMTLLHYFSLYNSRRR